jgi:glycosyltransferase involved in cell wall biosynthesis
VRPRIFIIVPSAVPMGPIKGAYALANAIVREREVTLVTVRDGPGAEAPLSADVRLVSLQGAGSIWRKIATYRRLLAEAGGRSRVASISLCLSADFVNLFSGRAAATCASVRGNLPANYRMDYGWPGTPLAHAHLLSLRAVDRVIAMNDEMSVQVRRATGREPAIIANFVDEDSLEPFRASAARSGAPSFLFLGSLSERKQPLLAVRALAQLRAQGIAAQLDLVGDGPLRAAVEAEIVRLGLADVARVHGFVAAPYAMLASACALLLPSLSEGMARACLEALYLGVPCVLRRVDGNANVLRDGVNGALFSSDADLPSAMARALSLSDPGLRRESILPPEFRQAAAAQRHLDLVDSIP